MDFAIKLEGEEQGRWVLHVDPIGERFLITSEDNGFRWIAMADCTLMKARNPDLPLPVIMAQPNQKVAVPDLRLDYGPQGHNGR